MKSTSRRLAMATFAAALAAAPLVVTAQPSWPNKPIRMIVSYPAGGVSDVVARSLGEKLSAALGVSMIVENKAGAGGSLGLDAVAKSAPDGYTLGFSSISPLALNPHLGKSPFDPVKDLAPVVSVMYSPVLILGTSANKAKDFPALLAQSKAHPGEVRWATAGLASLGHIMLEQIMHKGKVEITHVPYKGGGQQLNDGLGGQFEILSTNVGPAVLQHIKAGKFQVLAVGAPKRIDSLPQAPTLAELGYPAANMTSLFGIFAPAGTPEAVLKRLNTEINKALATPDLQAKLKGTDNVPTGGTAAEFVRQIASESDNNARIIKAANIQMN